MADTLESLSAVELPKNFGGVLVVENGGPAATAESAVRNMARQLRPEYVYIEQPGKCHALNRAMEMCRGSLVYFTDDDVRFKNHIVMRYVAAARHSDRASYFGGSTAVDYAVAPPLWLVPYLPPSARGLRPETMQSPWFLGFNWAAYADDIVEAGGFDETIGPGSRFGCQIGDETGMQNRLRDKGLTPRYVADAVVFHRVPANRCSVKWTLNRAYQSGLLFGFQEQLKGGNRRQVFGYPRWMLRAGFALWVRALWYTLVSRPERSFRDRYEWARFRGWMRGVRLRKRLTSEVSRAGWSPAMSSGD